MHLKGARRRKRGSYIVPDSGATHPRRVVVAGVSRGEAAQVQQKWTKWYPTHWSRNGDLEIPIFSRAANSLGCLMFESATSIVSPATSKKGRKAGVFQLGVFQCFLRRKLRVRGLMYHIQGDNMDSQSVTVEITWTSTRCVRVCCLCASPSAHRRRYHRRQCQLAECCENVGSGRARAAESPPIRRRAHGIASARVRPSFSYP